MGNNNEYSIKSMPSSISTPPPPTKEEKSTSKASSMSQLDKENTKTKK